MDWDQLQSSLGWFRAETLPELAETPGYESIFFGVNREDGTAAAVTLWETEEALRASETVEERVRTEATRRAGVKRGRVVNRYEVATQLAGPANPGYARLVRWSALSKRRVNDGIEVFKRERAPLLTELAGFSGCLVGFSVVRGQVFGVFLWDSLESLRGSEGWERESAARLESATGPRGRSIFEVYEVAIAPQLARQSS
jgi:heme-degrading monooxygenase HmoA